MYDTLKIGLKNKDLKLFSFLQGGEFYFLEHVAAEKGTWLFLLQKIVNPLWNFFTLGCCLQRQTWVIIEQAGFSKVDYKKFSSRIRMPVVKPSIYGTATK